MANYDVIIRAVDQTKSAVRSVESGLKGVQRQAEQVNKSLGQVGSLLAAVATSAVVAKIGQAARSFGDLEARIRATSGSGAETAQVMQYLGQVANRLGTSLQDTGAAFSILRANGIDASYDSLESFQKLALSSGRSLEDIADAVANAYQGSFGKLSKATEDAIQVEEKYGQYVVKVRGQVLANVATTGQVVDVIRRYTQENAAFADSFTAKSQGISAALNRLQTALTGNQAFGDLNNSIGGLIDAFTRFIGEGDRVGLAIRRIATAINFIADNFNAIITILTSVTGAWLVFGKVLPAVKAGVDIVGKSLAAAGGFFKFLLTPITIAADALKFFALNLGRAAGILPTAYGGVASLTFAVGALVKGGLRLFGWVSVIIAVTEAVNLLVKAFTGFDILDWVSKKFDALTEKFSGFINKVREYLGLSSKAATAAPTTTAAEFQRGDKDTTPVPKPPASAVGTTNTGAKANTFLDDIMGNLKKARGEMPLLEKELKKALSTGDLSLASKLFEELASRADQFGIVVAKDAQLVRRDFATAIAKSTEELRVAQLQLADTQSTIQQFGLELDIEAVALQKRGMLLTQSNILSKIFNNELQASQNALTESAARLANVAVAQEQFNISIAQNRIALDTQRQTLGFLNSALAAGKITLEEYSKAVSSLDPKLLSATERYNLFKQSLADGVTAKALAQEQVAWAQATGDIELYVAAYQQYKSLLGSTVEGELATAINSAKKDVKLKQDQATALGQLQAQFKAGSVSAREFAAAAGTLGMDTEAIDRMVNVYGSATDRMVADTEFLKKSISSAATTFSNEFTQAIMKGEFKFSSFKNFVNNILTDIANRIIKRQFADPLADALEKVAGEIFPQLFSTGPKSLTGQATTGGATAGQAMTEAMQSAGNSLTQWFQGWGSGIGEFFSGLGSSITSILGDVFSWAMDGLGSIGSSLGGLFGGGGSDFLGSIAGSIGSFFGFADGGNIPAGQVGLVGERGPEFITGPAGITPMDAAGSSEPLTVNFTLNAIDTRSGVEFLLQNKQVITKVIEDSYNRRGRRGPITA